MSPDVTAGAVDLDGAVVVVTGATRGIGRETARAFGARGARVVVVGRSTKASPHKLLPGSLEEVEESLRGEGVDVLAVRADLGQLDQVDHVAEATLEWAGRCDVLVNNAAYTTAGPVLEVPAPRWRLAFDLAVTAPMRLVQGLVPGMLERGAGRVVSISSGAALDHYENLALYSVSKRALEHWSELMEAELGGRGVAFNVLRIDEPVPTEAWHMVSAASGVHDEQVAASGGSTEGMVTPAQCAGAVVWIAEQPSTFSGAVLGFDDLRRLGGLG